MSDAQGSLGVVVVAAGSSSRMEGIDKQVAILGGEPVISHSIKVFEQFEKVGGIVLVMSIENLEEGKAAVRTGGFSKVVRVLPGGNRRQDSVKIGLTALEESGTYDFIAVHDGARPFIDPAMLERGLLVAKKVGSAIAAVPVKDTIKMAPHRVVTDTPDRSQMWAIQTPQIFRLDILKTAHEMITDDVTDDASMVESVGGLVAIFDGSNDNIKITTPQDMKFARLLYDRRIIGDHQAAGTSDHDGSRFGIGFDGHQLIRGGPLLIGGVKIDFEYQLAGHSDGDVLMHAVASAILGAAGLGDLGSSFPSGDKKYAGLDSAQFIAESTRMAFAAGWMVCHVDATVIAQRPRLSSYSEAMEANIAAIDGLENSSVNVKITSTDQVGAIGAGQGIAAQAIATLIPA